MPSSTLLAAELDKQRHAGHCQHLASVAVVETDCSGGGLEASTFQSCHLLLLLLFAAAAAATAAAADAASVVLQPHNLSVLTVSSLVVRTVLLRLAERLSETASHAAEQRDQRLDGALSCTAVQARLQSYEYPPFPSLP